MKIYECNVYLLLCLQIFGCKELLCNRKIEQCYISNIV